MEEKKSRPLPFGVPPGLFTGPQILPGGKVWIPTGPPVWGDGVPVKLPGPTPWKFPDFAQCRIDLVPRRLGKELLSDEVRRIVIRDRSHQTGSEKDAGVSVMAYLGAHEGKKTGFVLVIIGYSKSEKEPEYADFSGSILSLVKKWVEEFGQEAISVDFYKGSVLVTTVKMTSEQS